MNLSYVHGVGTTPLLAEFQVPTPQIRHNVKAKQRFRIS